MAKQKDDSHDEPEPRPASRASDLMTTKDLMEYLQVSRTKVWELVHSPTNPLPSFKIGGDYRYRRSEVDAWIEGKRFVPGSEPRETSE